MPKNIEYTVVINSDKRYYLDEAYITDGESLADTITRFNDIKINLYNVLYDNKFRECGPLSDKKTTATSYLKKNFGISDYYCAAISSAASSVISSQSKTFRLNIKAKEADIKARKEKIAATEATLAKKKAIKSSIVQYIKTGMWQVPYAKCNLQVRGKCIGWYGKRSEPIEEFERRVENTIRGLKSKVALLKKALQCAEERLEKLRKAGIQRAIFGSKTLYAKKDSPNIDMTAWHTKFKDARHASMSLPGRHTSRYGNYLCRYDERTKELSVTCMDGKIAVLKDFKLARYHNLLVKNMLASPKERESLCYNFQIKRDNSGRQFLIVSVTLHPSNNPDEQRTGLENGCVAMDMNVDHFAVTDIDKDGNRIESKVFRFNLNGKSSGQISETIGRTMSFVGKYCEDRGKCLVIENLNTTNAKRGLRYKNRKSNRKVTTFAYDKMRSCAINQGYKRKFTVYAIDPAYTSVAGKFLYMRKFGISIHEAASYIIGLVAMDRLDLCAPPPELTTLLPKKKPKKEADTVEEKKPETVEEEETTQEDSPSDTEPPDEDKQEPLAEKKKRRITIPRDQFYKVQKTPVQVVLDFSIRERYKEQWDAIISRTKGIRVHAFYRYVTETHWKDRKRRTLISYAAILKELDNAQRNSKKQRNP